MSKVNLLLLMLSECPRIYILARIHKNGVVLTEPQSDLKRIWCRIDRLIFILD